MTSQYGKKHVAALFRTILLTCSFVLTAGAANAEATKVTLTGAYETPPVKTTATGSGMITFNADKTVTGTVVTSGIVGTVAHIHLGAEGKKGPPIITLIKSGESGWSVPAGAMLTAEQYDSYKAGNLYINVHSAEYKDGEIRGQIKP